MMPGLEALITECVPHVAPSTMMRIVKVESGGRPSALNVVGKKKLARQPADIKQAITWAKWLIANGYGVAMGLSQIYSKHLTDPKSPAYGLSVEQIFEPCTNLRIGGYILQGNYVTAKKIHVDEQTALAAAFSAYNTGNFKDGFRNGYVQMVANAKVPASMKGGN